MKDLIVGETYFVYIYTSNWIIRPLSNKGVISCISLLPKDRTYYNNGKEGGCWGDVKDIKECRLATPEEKAHLEMCIKAGKYVDYKPLNKIVYRYSESQLNGLRFTVSGKTYALRLESEGSYKLYEWGNESNFAGYNTKDLLSILNSEDSSWKVIHLNDKLIFNYNIL